MLVRSKQHNRQLQHGQRCQSLGANTTGSYNTANGASALHYNTTGNNNIALGLASGSSLTAGNNNIDIGNPGVAVESDTIRIGTQVAVTDTEGFCTPPTQSPLLLA